MSRNILKYSAVVASLLVTALVAGCGTSNKEGNANLGSVAKVDEALCAQCHGSAREKLTGRVIYDDYRDSVHALQSVGCQDCHGGGAQHNGVGPIPFAKPNHEQCKTCHTSLVAKYVGSQHLNAATEDGDEKCNRCHTHQGAVLAAQFGFTGDKSVMDAMVNAPGPVANAEPIKCNTCHLTHKPQELRVDAAWAPSTAVGAATDNGSEQYKLCTQCHTYITPDGKLAATGNNGTGKFYHDTAWNRTVASTHYDNPATEPIEGYGVRTTGTNPCFDCHGHESKTNTNILERNADKKYVRMTPESTIYTDWAKSGHAGAVLDVKYAAVDAYPKKTDGTYDRSAGMTDAVLQAAVSSGPWSAGETQTSCSRCHTSTGLETYLSTGANPTVAVSQTEILNCWGCHSNAGDGTLRTLKGTKATTNYTTDLGHKPTGYTLNYGKKIFPDVAGSNLCVSCHDGRYNDPGSITTANVGPVGVHYMPAAAVMYVKMGFLNLSTGTAGTTTSYLESLKADLDGGKVTSTHRKLGTPAIVGNSKDPAFFVAGNLDSNGPCAVCHLKGSHSLKIDQKAIDAVCSKCHDSEAGISLAKEADFIAHFIEPQAEVFHNAVDLAVAVFNSNQTSVNIAKSSSGSYTAYRAADGIALSTRGTGLVQADLNTAWANAATGKYSDKTKLFGAISNLYLFDKDKAAYAHARTYTRRLLYDTIDYLDDGILNMSVSATATAANSALYAVGTKAYITSATVGDKDAGTSESMLFLKAYNRTSGAWTAVERP